MIEISVDMGRCQHYGQCALEAPAVFQLDDDDHLRYRSSVRDGERPEVENALDVCPMQAISISGSDSVR